MSSIKLYMPTTKIKLNITYIVKHSIHVRIQHDQKYIIDCILSFYTALNPFECSVFFNILNQFKFKILGIVNFYFSDLNFLRKGKTRVGGSVNHEIKNLSP